jgi:hypothetical protein
MRRSIELKNQHVLLWARDQESGVEMIVRPGKGNE